MENKIIWQPSHSRIQQSWMWQFAQSAGRSHGLSFTHYRQLYDWSVGSPEEFWRHLLDFFPVIYSGDPMASCGELDFLHYPWFPHLKLNFAENLLAHGEDGDLALCSLHESGKKREITYRELRESVAKLQQQLRQVVGEGDVVACYMPNILETVVTMLATTGLGGVFTSTSCDFGVEGVVDRFGQTEPKVLVTVSAYSYQGKVFDLGEKIAQIRKSLPSLKQVIVVDFLSFGTVPGTIDFAQVMEKKVGASPTFVRGNFSAPLYVMYSSGTTGKPKCIVHSVGGTLLQHIKELGLHGDIKKGKNIMYFTTCGWMMWNWLVSSLFFGAKVSLYEGSPKIPTLKDFIHLIDGEGLHIFGTSPKFLRGLEEERGDDLGCLFPALETIFSTGAPLLPEQFDYVYRAFKEDLLLGSICGGTDLLGCFMLANPLLPVRRGEIQAAGLGMNIAAYDEEGRVIFDRPGELVCRTPFISQPIGFLGDSADKEHFSRTYFERFPKCWHQGDFITHTKGGGVVVHGRSDATLNPGGVRVGTAEIYAQVELISYVEDSLCVGHQVDGDVEVLLFVQCKEGEKLDKQRVGEIKDRIRRGASPRHVPGEVYEVEQVPYTMSGKKMEMAIIRIMCGQKLGSEHAMVNPKCLKDYRRIYRLRVRRDDHPKCE